MEEKKGGYGMHFTFWETIVYYALLFSLGLILQINLAHKKRPIWGRVLPLILIGLTFYWSTPNFLEAFIPHFNPLIFLSAFSIFVVLAVPAIIFIFIDLMVKQKLAQRRKRKKQKLVKKRP